MIRVEWTKFDYAKMADIAPLPRRKGNPAGTGKRPDYLPVIATMDTETTTILLNSHNKLPSKEELCKKTGLTKHAFVYVWMFYLPHIDTMVTGRTIEDYAGFVALLSDQLQANLICYVHNLSFEWQFLSDVYDFGKDGAADVFTVKPRKILQATMCKIEHRCSALLSNQSLKSFCINMGVEHQKLSGDDYDYSKIRYPWTTLDEETEWPYCTNDVVGLAEAVLKRIEMSGKDLYHFPFTSTGFVRQDLRRAVRHISDGLFREIQPSYEVYKLLRKAFRGGDTHANRLTVGEVNPAGYSYDRSSSYPHVQCCHLFPMTPFKKCENLDIEYLLERNRKYKRALLLQVKFYNLRLRDENWGFPYMPADYWHSELPRPRKEKHGDMEITVDPVEYDNGRVLSTPWVTTVITDVDLDIILQEYEWDDIEVFQAYESRYGIIPPAFTDVVAYYYTQKTELKGNDEQIILYNLMKALLNAIYGCTAQDVIKPDLAYDPLIHDWDEMLYDKQTGEYTPLYDKKELDQITDKDEHYKAVMKAREAANEKIFHAKIHNAWLPYQLAVWTTAWARWELHRGLHNVVDQGGLPLYCDTDSVKYLGDQVRWDKLNNELQKGSEDRGAYAKDIKGKIHYMGVWEKEGKASHSFERFASLGAKKYAYEELDPVERTLTLKTTIAAVTKDGAAELAAAFGPSALDRFAACRYDENEFTFVRAGGTALIYNDDDDIDLEIDGHHLHIGRNVVITDDTYRLSLQEEYSSIIKPAKFLDMGVD